jgi:hypothetical protein
MDEIWQDKQDRDRELDMEECEFAEYEKEIANEQQTNISSIR